MTDNIEVIGQQIKEELAMRTYISISLGIVVLRAACGFVSRFILKSKISRNPVEFWSERMRASIKVNTWTFIPIVRWIVVWGVYKELTSSDEELLALLNKNESGNVYSIKN